MAATPTLLTSGTSTSDPATTASVSPTAGALLELDVITCRDSSAITQTHLSVSGLGATWVLVGFLQYGTRRGIWRFRCQSDGTAGTISIDYVGPSPGSFAEHGWALKAWSGQVAGNNGADGVGTPASGSTPFDSVLTLGTVGALSDGDAVSAVFGIESDGGAGAITGYAELVDQQGSNENIRQMLAGWHDSDVTAGISWTGTSSAGGIANRIIAAAAAGPTGSAASQAPAAAGAGSGAVSVAGAAGSGPPPAAGAGVAAAMVTGSGVSPAPAGLATGTGTVGDPGRTGTVASVAAAAAAAGAGTVEVTGAVVSAVGAGVAAGTGVVGNPPRVGSATSAAPAGAAAAAGLVPVAGAGAAVTAAVTAAGAGQVAVTGAAGSTAPTGLAVGAGIAGAIAPAPYERTAPVLAEVRRSVVTAEVRVARVLAEQRTLTVMVRNHE